MSRFFSMIWRLEALDAEWTVLALAGAWIFPKYAKLVTDAKACLSIRLCIGRQAGVLRSSTGHRVGWANRVAHVNHECCTMF